MMEGPRSVRIEELPLVEKLANTVFRLNKDAPQTMFQEYPDLYSIDNMENIMVIKEDGKIVSNINYLPQIISVFGCSISAATLGGVATLKEYRGRGYSSLLLDSCIRNMEEQGINVLHVSGDRLMYRNAGCMPAGLVHVCDILPGHPCMESEDVLVEEYTEVRLYEIARIYGREGVRYVRTSDRLHQLLSSRKFIENSHMERKDLLISRGQGIEAYVSVLVEGGKGRIVDCAGPKKLILEASCRIIEACGIGFLSGYVMPYETDALWYCSANGIHLSDRQLGGTIRIINFKGLMESLRPHFYELYSGSFVKGLEFGESAEGFVLQNRGRKYIIPDRQQLNWILFGGGPQWESFGWDEDSLQLREFLEAVFPIPFVYTENLSCV